MKRILCLGMLLILAGKTPGSAAGRSEELLREWNEHHRDPVDYVVAKFKSRKWVFLGEYHRIKHDVDLVTALIPTLHGETDVRHLALEFLCRGSTEEANQLVTAPAYDRKQALDFFRRQFPSWPYEEYLDILRTTWGTNRALADQRGVFRLVGLHPCPDYEVMHFSENDQAVNRERAKLKRYDEIMAEALEEQVLAPGTKALVYLGIAHATAKFQEFWYGTDKPLPRMGNLLYRPPYKNDMFFICLHAPFWDSGSDADIYPFDGILDRLMRDYQKDIGFDVVGTPFENLEHATKSQHAITRYRFGELYDGYIIRKTPLKETMGATCIENWIDSEDEYRYFWRHMGNKSAALSHSETPLAEFKRDFCSPGADHGAGFSKRFRSLPDLP